MRFECVGGIDDKAHIRLAILVQRRRHTKDQGITFTDTAEIGRGLETACTGLSNFGLRNMFDIALPGIKLVNLDIIDIDTQDIETNGVVSQHQW